MLFFLTGFLFVLGAHSVHGVVRGGLGNFATTGGKVVVVVVQSEGTRHLW